MTKRRYQYHTEEKKLVSFDTQLPVHLPVANYYRQSTTAQVGNFSTHIQTVNMVDYLKRLGWQEENILMVDMDAGVSGTKKIDEREGMSQLFQMIISGRVGAVSAVDEDRFFRDVTQIQVNIFIEACKQHKVLVITPSMIYSFHHEQMGIHHARQFRWKSEVAADYITSYILGKLHEARQELVQNGRWSGHAIPLGFMIDDRKKLPDGRPNENWRKFAIFEPYAEVVREYWSLFLSFGGQIRKTTRHVQEHGPYFPDPQICQPPEGFRVAYKLPKNTGKWCLGRTGLRYLLTNAMYIGHWVSDNEVVIWNNHPAIIDPHVFMRAFNYLSDVTLEGEPNLDYAPIQIQARPSLDEQRMEERPLSVGLVVSQESDGQWTRTGCQWDDKSKYFAYRHTSKKTEIAVWQRKASFIDDTVTELLLEKLKATFNFEAWKATLDNIAGDFKQERQLLQAQTDHLTRVMDNLLMSLGTLKNPQMIAAVEKQYTEAQRELERLKQEMYVSMQETQRQEQIEHIKESCEDVINDWPAMTTDERRLVVHLFVARIEATKLDDQAIHLRIIWQDASENEVTLPRDAGNGKFWMTEEMDKLVALMQSGADQITVAAAFPDRSWGKIRRRYVLYTKDLGKYERLTISPKPIREYETYNEYLKRSGQESTTSSSSESYSATSHRRNRLESGLFHAQ